ncbi:hypothetical protein [Thermofilum pendens]|uniref:Clan AA aspartic protease n=1 Tax=Thermofilum pendens (strain DSM 2475 / Hrk 5) TaxID=368408 RepID=A1S078_THEPD|nr:hypothetical protein [Thermofilum pendens]ABL78858.1 hypothetical protein Tpen_1461 [Thermofilum pendens Hrk 5]
MGIRVRVRIVVGERSLETSALLNSGFESDEPDVCIPVALARRLGLWPPQEVRGEDAFTAGGEVTLYVLSAQARIQLLAGGEVKSEAACVLVVNPYVDEVLLSDYVMDELGVVALSFRRGLWRHASDPPSTVRESEKPEYW